MRMFSKLKFDEKFDYEYIYPTIHDAVMHIFHRNNLSNDCNTITISNLNSLDEINETENKKENQDELCDQFIDKEV